MIFTLRWLPRFAALLALVACGGDGEGDPPDEEPYGGCHVDCFRYVDCADGIATQYVHAPIPCSQWEGSCPITTTYTCEKGCRVDVERIDSSRALAPDMCEENRPKRPGDPCADESDCHPQVADVPWEGPITHVYLRCDLDAGRCVERPAPPRIPDFLESCDIGVDDPPRFGLHENTACASGWCYVDGSTSACVYQGCTAPCADDGDCPPGTLCSETWQRDDRPRACTPSRHRDIDDVLSCWQVPEVAP